ncbi:AraC family transcriptional regulator [Labrenzia sp. OB1]|uniref:helix-turn-helix domain-containing protein n=1 Tax=Labrenzia sp. OB1 TaxID=1561204 RepID=UPI000837AC67|nr:AraC family transcriptional regulator [Labrenzia sp. OB1]
MSFDLEHLLVASVTATFTVAVLAAIISWSQRKSVPPQRILTVFFAAFALSEIDSFLAGLTRDMPQVIRDTSELASFVANFCLMPLILLYVRDLTDLRRHFEGGATPAWHFVLPGVTLVFSVIVMALPEATRGTWYTGTASEMPLPGLGFLHYGFSFLTGALLTQWAIYLVWITRLQARHIAQLKQHFASTDGLELRWIVVLAFALGSYVVQTVAGEILVLSGLQDPIGPLLDSFLVLIIVSSLALWSLRPSPELQHATESLGEVAEHQGKKYEKSALGADQSERIARKLLRAMQEDHLYRDPNLTLHSLSAHVGVSLNYVSQTLNENLGQSFFEFVNGWRVKEAIPLIEAGKTTVLAIAYEVGFNSRSSFYSAFKRSTGMTPTAYKTAQKASREYNA